MGGSRGEDKTTLIKDKGTSQQVFHTIENGTRVRARTNTYRALVGGRSAAVRQITKKQKKVSNSPRNNKEYVYPQSINLLSGTQK